MALLTAAVGACMTRTALAAGPTAVTGTETVLYSFANTTDGWLPSDLVQLADGALYGITAGTGGVGPVTFKLTTAGAFTALNNLCLTSSSCPAGINVDGLVAGADGNLYGDTGDGGSLSTSDGTFFQITPTGTRTQLLNFTNVKPYPLPIPDHAHNLVLGTDGNFYGTSTEGGANQTGAIFKVTTAGVLTELYSFSALTSGTQTNADGTRPEGALVEASDGNFYGTANNGGANGSGTVYQITPAGVLTVIYNFSALPSSTLNADGAHPAAGLTIGTDGNFYGSASQGGANGVGTLFKLNSTPDHTFTKLHDFGATTTATLTAAASPATVTTGQSATLTWDFTDSISDSGNPAHSLVLGTDGNFYGATHIYGSNAGVAYQLTPAGVYTPLHLFGGTSTDLLGTTVRDGFQADALMLAADGNYYGTTAAGGANNLGTIFRLSVAPATATPCTASGAWSGAQTASGVLSVSQTTAGTYQYTLTCTGSGGASVSQSVSLTVTAPLPVPTVTIAANPTAITLGQSATLTWATSNATACTASGAWSGSEAVGASNTQAVTPTVAGANLYTLTCTGPGGSANAAATVTATAPPTPTVTIAANPTAITLGQSATLTWTTSNATACTASGAWSGSEGTGESITHSVTPTVAGANLYTLTCTGPGGSANATATVTATAPPPTPAVTLAVSPTAITQGQSATLTWTTSNATACTASGAWSGSEAAAASNTLSVTPTMAGANVYTITCTGAGGSATASATLTVSVLVTTSQLTGQAGGGGGLGLASVLGLLLMLSVRIARERGLLRARVVRLIAPFAALALIAGAASIGPVGRAVAADAPLAFRWDQAYAGLRVGSTTYSESTQSLDGYLAGIGDTGTSVALSRNRTGGVLFAGVPFYRAWALELGVADLGTYPFSVTTTANVTALAETLDRHLPPAGWGLTLGLAAPMDLNHWFAIEPRLGLLGYASRQEVHTGTGTIALNRHGLGLDAGLSLLAHVSRHLVLGASVDCLDTHHDCNVLLISGQIEYRFGE